MRVLLTHEAFAPDFAGGGEYVALETARHLIGRGVDLRVLTTGDPQVTSYEGIETVRLPMHRYRFNLAAGKIAALAEDVDLIQTFNYHASLPSLIAGRRLGKPVVCIVLGLFSHAWKEMRGPISGRLWMRWERYVLSRDYARVMFLSNYSREQGIAMGVPADRAKVNSPGIDLDAYGPAEEKEDVVLFVGKVHVRKGVDDIMAVAEALPEVKFRVMGWGPQEADFKRRKPHNVEFTAFERGRVLAEAFARARIFLFPSKAETFGISLIEAMASGCAVVSTVPLDFAGVRVAVGDRPAMIEGVRRLWNDRAQTEVMGRRNVEIARPYSWDRNVSYLLSTYCEVLAEFGSNPSPKRQRGEGRGA
ncbi:MAG: glycosyltransferase family 4 protein [Phycisphaerae bacterium]